MSETEFKDDLRQVVKKHSDDLDADDLRTAADELISTAEAWEAIQL